MDERELKEQERKAKEDLRMDIDMQKCSQCRRTKVKSRFTQDQRNYPWYRDFHGVCVDCLSHEESKEEKKEKIAQTKRDYKEKHRDRLNAVRRMRYQEKKSVIQQNKKKWRDDNPEKVRESNKKWYWTHRDKELLRKKEDYKKRKLCVTP